MKIAIVGAGISGLTCAYELQERGHNVTVFEKERSGGRMLTYRKRGFLADIGANFIRSDAKLIPKYCKKLGVPYKRLPRLKRIVRMRGKAYPFLLTPRAVCAFFPTNPLELLRAWLRAMMQCKGMYDLNASPQSLDTPSAKQVLDNISSKWGEYLMAGPLEALAFSSPSRLCGSIALNSIRQSFLHPLQTRFCFGAIDALPVAFTKRLNIRKQAVTRITPTAEGVRVKANKTYSFDKVVIATPKPHMIYKPTPNQKRVTDNLEYASAITGAFIVPKGAIKDFSFYFVPSKEGLCTAALANEGRKHIKKGQAVLGFALHGDVSRRLLKEKDAQIFDLVREELPKLLPGLDMKTLKNFTVKRWESAIPIYTPTYVSIVRNFWQSGQGEGNVYFCGDYLNHPFVEGAMRCGLKVANLIGSVKHSLT